MNRMIFVFSGLIIGLTILFGYTYITYIIVKREEKLARMQRKE